MRLFKNLVLVICLFSLNAQGQTTQYKALLDTAIKFNGQLFVSVKPLTKIRFDENNLRDNWDDFTELFKDIDSIKLYQIIKNSKQLDTLYWTDIELDRFLLVQDREQDVRVEYAVNKFNLTDKRQIRFYKKQINQFNSVNSSEKNIYYYSRPVFDDTKHFAIIQWDNGHGLLGGGGGIRLYNLKGDTWKEVGFLARWQY
jgi:hypothetical protein